jgi:hypothetical protein
MQEHWWWLMKEIFTAVPETKERNDYVLFIEEDHLLASDALTTLAALTSFITQRGGCVRISPSA